MVCDRRVDAKETQRASEVAVQLATEHLSTLACALTHTLTDSTAFDDAVKETDTSSLFSLFYSLLVNFSSGSLMIVCNI